MQLLCIISMGFPGRSACKESACNAGDLGSIPGLEISPGERKVYPLQYSGLENSMDCIDNEVTKSWTQLNNFHFTSCSIYLNRWWMVRRLLTILEIKRLEIYGFIEIVIKNMKFLVRQICVQIKNLPLVWNLAKAT